MSIAREEAMYKLIQNFSANTRKTAKQKQTKGYLGARRKLLEDYWSRYTAAYDEILIMVEGDDKKEELQTFRDGDRLASTEMAYCEALGELNDMIDDFSATGTEALRHSTPNQTLHRQSHVTKSILPKIELPKFNGTFQQWLNFKDMFTACVKNDTSLSNVERLHYLKCSLQAWEILQQRYDNKRRLIKSYLRDIWNMPKMSTESAALLRKIVDGTTEAVRALSQLERPTSQWDDWLVFLTTEKLDSVTLKDWEMSLNSPNEIPTYNQLVKFLENRIQGLEATDTPKARPKDIHTKAATSTQSIRSHQSNLKTCPKCAGKHILMYCSDFRKFTPADKLQFIIKAKLCKNCFKCDHTQTECPSKFVCLKCKEKHHTFIHDAESVQTSSVATNNSYTPNLETLITAGESLLPLAPVMLATAHIGVRSATGHFLQLRALLDNGSQASFISEFAVQQLHLRRTRLRVSVTGVGGSAVGTSTGLVQLSVSSLRRPGMIFNCAALILPRLGHLMPNNRIDAKAFGEFMDLDLADPTFYKPGSIDLILGADLYGSLICNDIKHLSESAPIAQNTHLGWVIYGRLPKSATLQLATTFCASTYTELADLVQNMWKFIEGEDLSRNSAMTLDELYCEEYFQQTTRRNKDGRFVVRYPFKKTSDLSELSATKSDALKLFTYQQNRLLKDPKMQALYDNFMAEYQLLGHMEHVVQKVESTPVCYIPHHGVYKEFSSTTKLRVVFNAARKTKSGVSLNDCLYVGPKLQNDLTSLLMRWRTHRIGFMADIEKCYRQILVDSADADMQRIFWHNTDGVADIYRLLTVTYGLNCSPYLTIKVLHALAKEEETTYPEASRILQECFYMDDCLHGADTEEAAFELQGQLQNLLKSGGFLLRKWNSNSSQFLHRLNVNEDEIDICCDLNFDKEARALGIYWYRNTDTIGYKINIPPLAGEITKRQQLSDVCRIYDPTCLLAPVTITGKIMAQQLWLCGCKWDDPMPAPQQQNWIKFRDELPLVENIKVPRWVSSSPSATSYQLHVFADASSAAYAAVAYLRVETPHEPIKVSVLMAKTKVAPLKKISVPCLELNGALLAAKVATKALQALQLPSIQTFCWSDARTVLCWIRSNPGQHKQYIANRVTKIQELTSVDSWRYVPTKTNPADVASRGVFPSALADLDIWWSGPPWLHNNEILWPSQPAPLDNEPDNESIAALHTVSCHQILESKLATTLLHKYSTLNKLLAVTSWCRRFIAARLRRPHETTQWCTAAERNAALQFWIRYVQNQNFSNEISCILQSKPISRKSRLLKLNPMIDEDGLVRMNGRLRNAIIPTSERFPIILSKSSPLSTLIVANAHENTMHGATQATLNYVRRHYWLIDARYVIKSYIDHCVKCIRQKSKTANQILGPLPVHRCNPGKPFQHCGLDYAGPYKIRTTKGRGHKSFKGYVALFVCFITRAVHLELVSDMTTECFLAALRRFFAARGYSKDIYSDCATTFVGANAILKENFKECKNQLAAAAQLASCHGVSWHFIPPGSPNFGGIWEAGVKSMKHHLKRTIGDALLTFEEFFTVLKQVEAVLNSRPLSALSDDPTDCTALTPGHFLVGGPLTMPPEANLLDINRGRLTRWKQLQQMQQDFWKRWSFEYLHELQVRRKWPETKTNLKLDDLVLIRDERAPPSQWLLGRVLEVHAGDDDLVSNVTVIKRAISKLVVLPKDDKAIDQYGGRRDQPTQLSPQDLDLDEVGGNVKDLQAQQATP